eukprot:800917-Pelagomonas_calceolata.AAC.1
MSTVLLLAAVLRMSVAVACHLAKCVCRPADVAILQSFVVAACCSARCLPAALLVSAALLLPT